MKNLSATWYEVTAKYDKTQEDGSQKKVNELYLVDAVSCSDAENRVIEELKHYISGEFKVKSIKESSLKEVFFSDKDKDDRWYKVKLSFITIDEKTEKEKSSSVTYLVQASSVNSASNNIDKEMSSTMMDYISKAVQETKIIDVFSPHKNDKVRIPKKQ